MSDKCIFCELANNLPDNFLFENDFAYAIFDIKPITKGHCLVIPKKHSDNLSVTDDEYLKEIILLIKKTANKLKEMYPDIKGFNYVSNQGKKAKQVIFHLHFHIIPRY